jgi:hypothetical protein
VSASNPDNIKRPDWLWAGLLFAGSLTVYLRTLRPSFGWGDASELTTAAYFLGIGHSPGYPTYMMFGYLFSHLPFGDVAWRMNFMTAFFGALAVGLSYFVFRKIPCGRFGAFFGAVTFAFSTTFWELTTEAEVYTLHAAFVAAIILALLNWRQTGRPHLAWAALLAGISLGNHALTVLLLPGVIFFVGATKGWRYLFSKPMLLAAGAFILGAMVYLYLPLRGPAHPPPGVNDPQNLSQVLSQMTAPGSRKAMFSLPLPTVLAMTVAYGKNLPREISWAGVALGLLGAGLLWRKDRKLFGLLGLLFACNIFYSVNYDIFDIKVYFVTSYWVGCAFIALAGEWGVGQLVRLPEMLPREPDSRPSRVWPVLAGALALLLPFCLLIDHWKQVDMSRDREPEEFARAALQVARPNSLILGDWWPIAPLGYLKYVEGKRPDLTLDAAFSYHDAATYEQHTAPEYLRRFPAVYATEMLTYCLRDLREKYLLIPEGPLYRVLPEGPRPELARTDYQGAVKYRFGEKLALVGGEIHPKVTPPGRLVEITLYWQTLAPLGKEDKFDVLLELRAAKEAAWWSKSPLLHGLYPLEDWRPGQTLRQRFVAFLPSKSTPPGTYKLSLRVRQRGRENHLLPVKSVEGGKTEKSAVLATLEVKEEGGGKGEF